MDSENLHPVYDLYDSLNIHGAPRSKKLVSPCSRSNVWIFSINARTSSYSEHVGTNQIIY
jgi:hypothetical protein